MTGSVKDSTLLSQLERASGAVDGFRAFRVFFSLREYPDSGENMGETLASHFLTKRTDCAEQQDAFSIMIQVFLFF